MFEKIDKNLSIVMFLLVVALIIAICLPKTYIDQTFFTPLLTVAVMLFIGYLTFSVSRQQKEIQASTAYDSVQLALYEDRMNCVNKIDEIVINSRNLDGNVLNTGDLLIKKISRDVRLLFEYDDNLDAVMEKFYDAYYIYLTCSVKSLFSYHLCTPQNYYHFFVTEQLQKDTYYSLQIFTELKDKFSEREKARIQNMANSLNDFRNEIMKECFQSHFTFSQLREQLSKGRHQDIDDIYHQYHQHIDAFYKKQTAERVKVYLNFDISGSEIIRCLSEHIIAGMPSPKKYTNM